MAAGAVAALSGPGIRDGVALSLAVAEAAGCHDWSFAQPVAGMNRAAANKTIEIIAAFIIVTAFILDQVAAISGGAYSGRTEPPDLSLPVPQAISRTGYRAGRSIAFRAGYRK
ncbi:hypothetical protein ACFPL7_18460 [Dongia soli]|uniref:Tripartite ATP-independent transporter DctM subunit n=1 Tax=Dongia soli TaxID=600628 RepID=A0ABU5E5W2_9PROT|nr:hypothetical protein [Dongia soli]